MDLISVALTRILTQQIHQRTREDRQLVVAAHAHMQPPQRPVVRERDDLFAGREPASPIALYVPEGLAWRGDVLPDKANNYLSVMQAPAARNRHVAGVLIQG